LFIYCTLYLKALSVGHAISHRMNAMIVNWTGCGKKQIRLNFRYYASIRLRDTVKPWKSSFSIDGVPVEVRTSNLMNASPEALPVEPTCSEVKCSILYSLELNWLYRWRIFTSTSQFILNLQAINYPFMSYNQQNWQRIVTRIEKQWSG
jgi:hypothetical protein